MAGQPFTFEEAIAPASFTFEEATTANSFTFEEAQSAAPKGVQGGSTVASMAAATRHTLGVVGRAVAAFDLAQAGANAETLPSAPEAVATDEFGRPVDPRGRNPAQLNPAWEGTRFKEHEGLAPLMTPLVPLRKAFSQGEQLSYLATQQPEGAAKTALHAAGDVVTSTEDLVGGVMEFMTSPVGIATLGLGFAPGALRAMVSGGFSADMINHAAGDYAAFKAAKAAGDNVGQAEAIASGLRNLGMASLAGSHSYAEAYRAIKPKTPLETVAPLTAEAVARVAPIETKAAEPLIAQPEIKATPTPLTTAAVESVKKEPHELPTVERADAPTAPEGPATVLPSPVETAKARTREEVASDLEVVQQKITRMSRIPVGQLTVSAEQLPAWNALHTQRDSLSRELVAIDKPLRDAEAAAAESKLKAQMSERDKRVREAPVFQRNNGWEIVKEGVDYVLRDPNTKEEAYRGKLGRVRDVAKESTPEPPTKPEGERALTSENPFDTSVTSARLTELDKNKPRPTDKLYGKSGGTPELRAENDAKLRKWTNERSKAIREHRALVEQSNEWIRQHPTEPALTSEPVAKVQAEVSKVASEEGQRSAKEIKSELVTKLEEATVQAKSINEFTISEQKVLEAAQVPDTSLTRGQNYQYGKKGDAQRASDIAKERDKLVAKAEAEGFERITIEIPGDGEFTIWNTKEAISKVLKEAKRVDTKPGIKGIQLKYSKGRMDSTEAVKKAAKDATEIYGNPVRAKSVLAEQLAAAGELDLSPEQVSLLRSTVTKLHSDAYYNLETYRKSRDNAQARRDEHLKKAADITAEEMKESRFATNEKKQYEQIAKNAEGDAKQWQAKLDTESAKVAKWEATVKAPPAEAETGGEPQGAIATPGPPLAPATAPTPALPPKSQRQIITDIAQGLKLPIRFGRLRTNRFAGYFLKLQNLIGSKSANDIPIVSHEAGHKLDATFSFSNDPALRGELERLGDPNAIGGSRSSWTKSKTLKYKRGEGVAEFVRYYLTDPPAAAQHAPAMARAFEAALDSNKDFGDTMRQAQSDIQTWRNAEPQARLRSHISVGGNPNKTPYTVSQLTRDLVDDLHFLRLAANDAKAAGTDLSPSQNPYTLARNLRGSYGMADSFIRSGVADFTTKEVKLGTSLQDALKPVAGRIADFRDWIIAKRAQELHGQGRQTGLVDSDVQFTAAKFDGDAAFQDAFAKVKKWQDDLLQYAVDSGFVTTDGAAAMRKLNADYVPLHRVFEVGAGEAPAIEGAGTGRGLNVGKPGSLRRLTGSARDIVDPLETMVRNAYAIITASEKHAINLAVADMARLPDMGKWVEHIATPKERVQVGVEKLREQLESEGADMTAVPDDVMLQFFQNSKQAPFGENVIKVVRDGKAEFYRLKRELFETFNALDLEDSGTLVRMLSAPSQVLRAGVVLDPSFALANVMRDAFTSSIVSRHGLLPFEATLRGVAAMLKSPKLVAEWEAAGGKNAIEANYFDRQKLQKFLAEKITKDLTPAERALIAVKSPLQALRWLTSLGEEATRIGEYQKAFEDFRKSGMSEGDARRQAAFESRDRQDFAKGGAKTKIPRRLAAFWNAGIQGNVRLAQAFRERPMQTTMKGLAFITIPKLIEQSLNWNDDDYWDRPQWERDLFFLIPAGKGEDGHTRFIRIPTPFEAGVIFGTFPGRILQSVRESSAENLKTFPAVLAKQTIPNPTPQFALTIFEDFMVGKKGYDVYRGRQIVPETIAQLPADMQWTEQTSLAARKLGAALGFPPVKIDHIINQTTGGLGKQVTHQVIDRAISIATGEARTAKGVVPGGRFVTTPAAVSSQAIDDFYTTLDKVKTAAAGQKKGRDDELARWKPMFTATESRMSELRRAMRSTKDEAQKDAIAQQILELSRSTMKNFREQTK